MTLLSNKVTDIYGGVSQAPDASRAPNQFAEMLNSLPIFGKRLGRRPPLIHLAKLMSSVLTSGTSLVHSVSTTTGRRAHLIFSAAGAQAFDATTGAPITVISPDGSGSFAGGSMRAASNGDTTVITNPATVVGKTTATAPVQKKEALLYVRQGDYSTTYTVTLNALTVSYTTPDTTATGAKAAITTSAIGAQLQGLLLADATTSAAFYITLYGSTLYVVRKDLADFTASCSDGIADKGLLLIKGNTQRFTDLPTKCRTGVIVQITGDNTSAFTSYWVKYAASPTVAGSGVWVEVPKPGSPVALDASTMPYRCTFRGKLLSDTKHVSLRTLMPQYVAFLNLSTSLQQVAVAFPPDAMYPAGTPLTMALSAGGTNYTYSYTVGPQPESASTVAAGMRAAIVAGAVFVVAIGDAEEFRISHATLGVNSTGTTAPQTDATTFVPPAPIQTGYVGYIIKNATDGSFGTITASTATAITVASLAGGVTNLFNSGDVCYVVAPGDYFVFSQIPWAARAAGDDTTVPFPSFVGAGISEVFFHQGRLGFLSGSTVFLSRAALPFGLFRSTATQVLADDPIDIRNTTGDSSPFHSALEWNTLCYIFSGTLQYALDGGGTGNPLTTSTVRLRPVSKYMSSPQIRPVVAGNRLYFVALKSGFPRVLEYTIRGYEQFHSAEDTGRDLPTYFQGNALRMVVDDTQGVLLLLTDGNSQKTVYTLSYRLTAGEKQAAGWGSWTFANPVMALDSIDGHVGVMSSASDGSYLSTLLLDPQALPAWNIYYGGSAVAFGGFTYGQQLPKGLERIMYLDRRVNTDTPGVVVSYAGGVTTWTLPYTVAVDGSDGVLAVATEQFMVPLVTTRPTSTTISAVGDYRLARVYIGVLYTTSWTFNTLFLRDKEGEAEERGRLQVRYLRLRYADSTDLTVTVTIAGRVPTVQTLAAPVGSGVLLVPIQGRNTDTSIVVSNTTPGAGHLVSYDWEGTHHTRERAL